MVRGLEDSRLRAWGLMVLEGKGGGRERMRVVDTFYTFV